MPPKPTLDIDMAEFRQYAKSDDKGAGGRKGNPPFTE